MTLISVSASLAARVQIFLLLVGHMANSDRAIRESCEPQMQRLAAIVGDLFNPVTGGGDAGLLAYVADRLEKAGELIDDVRCSGISYTNPERYHEVQIYCATWDEINEFCGDK